MCSRREGGVINNAAKLCNKRNLRTSFSILCDRETNSKNFFSVEAQEYYIFKNILKQFVEIR